VPISTLGDDFYEHDEAARALVGKRSHKRFRLGDGVTVRLAEATPVTGGLRFEIMGSGGQSTNTRRGGKPAVTKKPTNRAPWSKHRSKKRK